MGVVVEKALPRFSISLNNRIEISCSQDGRGIFLAFHPVLPERKGKVPQAGVKQYDTQNAIIFQLSIDEAFRIASMVEQLRFGRLKEWGINLNGESKQFTLSYHDTSKAKKISERGKSGNKRLWIGKTDKGNFMLGASLVSKDKDSQSVSIPLTYESKDLPLSPRISYQIEYALRSCIHSIIFIKAEQLQKSLQSRRAS
jgi:hypothetical protein